jgi:hypothetical protein
MRSRDAVSRESTVSSEPVSRMKSCSRPPLTRAWTTILSFTSVKGIVWSMFKSCSSMSTGAESPNESRKSTWARAHAAFSLRSLLGSRLM